LHAQALLKSTPQGATDYLQADLRDPGVILRRAAEVLDSGQPAAVLLLGVLHLIQDSEDPHGIVARLMERGPEPGVRCGASGAFLVRPVRDGAHGWQWITGPL